MRCEKLSSPTAHRFALLATLLCALVVSGCSHRTDPADEHAHDGEDAAQRGPHGGQWLEDGDFAVELGIHETGAPPTFRAWLFEDHEPLPPQSAEVRVSVARLGGKTEEFVLQPEQDYLRSAARVGEPHSFDVTLTAQRGDQRHEWSYTSYEGRTTIPASTAQSMGVAVATAGPHVLKQQISLAGTVQADPTRISRVRARYPGVVRQIGVEPLSVVRRGDLLAQIQSNESLQNYSLLAPIAGTVVEHRAQVGEATGNEPLFTIVDVSRVWVELDVFQSDLRRIEIDQPAELFDLDGNPVASGRISRIAPLAAHGSQSVRARVVIDNAAGALRPGQFVSARIIVGESQVPLAVERRALQRFRDFDVVFERIGETYEVRMLELGRTDATHVEVLGGLEPGAQYVAANSFLIKADIEKSAAEHAH